MASAQGRRGANRGARVSFPSFLSRIEDSLLYAAPHIAGRELLERLEEVTVELLLDGTQPVAAELMVELAARLYPRIALAGDKGLVDSAEAQLRMINPQVDLASPSTDSHTVHVGPRTDAAISIGAAGLCIGTAHRGEEPAAATAQVIAASFAMSTLFQRVFADHLPQKSSGDLPVEWTIPGEINSSGVVDIGSVHLVGAGAIGQAFVWTLARSSVAAGSLTVVDPEPLDTSNLQRYVGTQEDDVEVAKVELVRRALERSHWQADARQMDWAAYYESLEDCRIDLAVLALDSARDRVGVQAGLPRSVLNAWTQPQDLGVSAHDAFGSDPCVSCLYPPRSGPARYERIAEAFGLHPNKVLAYVLYALPLSAALDHNVVQSMKQLAEPKEIPPEDVGSSLLEDLGERVPEEALESFTSARVEDLDERGICGGALLPYVDAAGGLAHVPLAHQSVLAGALLVAAMEAIALGIAWPKELRLDVLGALQVVEAPRGVRSDCFCQDSLYNDHWREKWNVSRARG